MKTTLAKYDNTKQWYVVDATDQVLGRLAVKIANVLRGRHKTDYTPHIDNGDYVIVVNADKIRVTGNKENKKQYMFYSGWMGNEKYVTLKDFRKHRPTFIVEHAVKGMLPKNKLSNAMLLKLKVFAGPDHKHEAQNPQPFNF